MTATVPGYSSVFFVDGNGMVDLIESRFLAVWYGIHIPASSLAPIGQFPFLAHSNPSRNPSRRNRVHNGTKNALRLLRVSDPASRRNHCIGVEFARLCYHLCIVLQRTSRGQNNELLLLFFSACSLTYADLQRHKTGGFVFPLSLFLFCFPIFYSSFFVCLIHRFMIIALPLMIIIHI